MLKLVNISFVQKNRKLLDSISLEVVCGKVTALIGPNGAGKTTLARIAAGQLKATTGEVLLANKALLSMPCKLRAKYLAILSQKTDLNFPLRVFDVVSMGRYPHVEGRESLEDEEICQQALALVECTHLSERDYLSLSGGEAARVQIARILAQIWSKNADEARVLILDEPIAYLDLKYQHLILGLLQKLKLGNLAILLVIHDLHLAKRYADTIFLLKQGGIFAKGSPANVLNKDVIEQAYEVDRALVTF